MKKKICGIVGYPLKKPRSISIWKKFFKKNNINFSMKKFEVKKKNLKKFIKFMKINYRFLATSVTMPYKIYLFKEVIINDEFAKFSKSINLILKKNKKLYGYNTDIYGALHSIKDKIKYHNQFLIIGLGGTGKAIFNYLKKKYKNKKFIIISKQNIQSKRNIEIYKKINLEMLKKKLFIINCSPLGSDLKKEYLKKSPISLKLIKNTNKNSFIFDVVYSPKVTLLNKYCKNFGLNYKNGLLMNTMQAQRALDIVFNK